MLATIVRSTVLCCLGLLTPADALLADAGFPPPLCESHSGRPAPPEPQAGFPSLRLLSDRDALAWNLSGNSKWEPKSIAMWGPVWKPVWIPAPRPNPDEYYDGDLIVDEGDEFSQAHVEAVFRGQSPHEAVVKPLVLRDSFDVVPVRTLSIPNPLALLGNPFAWKGRFRAAYGSNFGNRSLIHGNLHLESGAPFGIDAEANYREDHRAIYSDRRFWNGDANLIYRLSKIRYLVFRMGLGANWLDDGDGVDLGFNTTVGFDVRLKNPWYFSTTIDWGTVHSDPLFHWQITGGLSFSRLELFVGYDFFQIRSRERKNFIAGAGFWF